MFTETQIAEIKDGRPAKVAEAILNEAARVDEEFNRCGRAVASRYSIPHDAAQQLADSLPGCKLYITTINFEFVESGPRDGFHDPHRK